MERVTPTFCIINFCQARRALGCILETLAKGKDFLNLIWPKVAIMAWHIVFSKNP
jgi:hypothetical protein